MLKGKKILLGVTGSIAAYKTAALVRALIKEQADVRVVMTPSALSFVTPLTLATLSKNPVHSAYVEDEETGEWTNHVELGKWADLMLIAPLSANTLSKLVTGECDNLLMAVYLSLDCDVMIAPAMDLDMADHWTTQENISKLKEKGVYVLPFAEGELASGLEGKGRMQEPEAIAEAVKSLFEPSSILNGKRILVTAGPTYEAIDPVRFIGNHSSGKMGYAIAQEAAERGAQVTLVSGPSSLSNPDGVSVISVVSAEDMFNAVVSRYDEIDAVIMSAAVADYKPASVADQKIKKEQTDVSSISLVETQDILKHLGSNKSNQKLIGFALETNDELENGRKKLKAKNLDLLVLNSLRDEGAGFGTNTNKITLLTPDSEQEFELKSKQEVAKDILDALERLY